MLSQCKEKLTVKKIEPLVINNFLMNCPMNIDIHLHKVSQILKINLKNDYSR